MTASKSAWKKNLLKSSVPLEHEAACILSQNDFNVSAQYTYERLDGSIPKDFSVDVRGVISIEPTGQIGRYCVLDVFVECKYRQHGTSWMFLPEPKSRSAGLHTAVQAVDVMSCRFVTEHEWFDERESAAVCYSAIEVGDNTNNEEDDGSSRKRAPESQLRHGLRQLQYAMPAVLGARMRWVASRRPDENYPFFFAPILVTNAPLILAHADLDVQKVERADELRELGREVPYLIWSAGLGPDFYVHCQRQLRDLDIIATGKFMKQIEERREASGIPSWLQPSGLAELIKVDGSRTEQIAEFNNIIVTNIGSLQNVIAALRVGFERMAKSLRDKPVVRW